MKYRFTISNSRFSHSETYNTEGLDGEWLANYDPSQLTDRTCLVKEIDHKDHHVMFPVFESLMQNDCPIWVQSMAVVDNLVCKWEKL